MYEVVAFEYDEKGDMISQKNIGDIPYGGGRSDMIKADETCVKVQISFLNIGKESPFYDSDLNKRTYVKALSVIKLGENVDIVIDGETMVSKNSYAIGITRATSDITLLNIIKELISNIQDKI